MVQYPDVVPFSDSHLGCCDLPKRGVIHYGSTKLPPCRGVTTGMVIVASVVADLPKTEAPAQSPPTPAGASFRPPHLAELAETL